MALAFSVSIVSSFPVEERNKLYEGIKEHMKEGFRRGEDINVKLLISEIEIDQWKVFGLSEDRQEVEKVVAMEKSNQYVRGEKHKDTFDH